jgi:D-aspartate ligase
MKGPRTSPPAIVIGLDSITGLQTARLLARRDIPVVGIARSADHPSCRTSACDRLVVAAAGEDLVDVLERLARTFAEPPVLVPCTDLSVLALSEHRDRLAAYRSVLPARGVVERLVDKAAFQLLAEHEGLPIARTTVVSSRADAERAAASLRYPCVLKPTVKTERWLSATSAKVLKAADADALLRHYDTCRGWADTLIAQEWVEGPDTAHVTCNAYFDVDGRPHLTFVSRKLRQWPLEGGVGCLSEECREDEVCAVATRLFQRAGHRGLAYLEMKRDGRDGRYVIIEPNVSRPTGRSAAADAAGIDLVYAHYCDALDWPLPPRTPQAHGRAKWIYLRQDLQAAASHWRRGTLTGADWLRSLRGVRHDAVFSWRDPGPFLADLAVGVRKARGGRPLARRTSGVTDIDFDVHGIARIRLIDASPRDVAAVARQVGPPAGQLPQEPDLVIRFVDTLPIDGLHWVEYPRTGFTDDGFYALQSGKRPARVRLPLDQIGQRCEFVCQRGARAIPLLMAGVVLTALAKGWAPLHASAFAYEGSGVLVTGWAKGGKTEALLAFAAAGAEYVGDEWIFLSPEGTMVGIPEALRLQDWHLQQIPSLRRHVAFSQRVLFRAGRAVTAVHRRLPNGRLGRLLGKDILADVLPALGRQLNVQVNPLDVFGGGRAASGVALDKLIFMVSWADDRIVVERADGAAIARRMAASVMYELQPLVSSYLAWRFAFPARRNDLLERAATILPARLERILGARDAHVVRHPYPCRLTTLFNAMAPGCRVDPSARASGGVMRLTPVPQRSGG